VQLALGDHDGEVEVSVAGSDSSTYYGKGLASTEKCRLTTLTRLMKEHGINRIDLPKLDCQGAECDILPCSTGIFPKIRQIFMEFYLARDWTAESLRTGSAVSLAKSGITDDEMEWLFLGCSPRL